MNKQTLAFILFSVLVTSISCKSKKNILPSTLPNIERPSASNLLIQKIKNTENTFSYYSVRGKVQYKDQQIDQDLDVAIVMEKDKYIWMNVTAMLGIEAARIKITTDSIIILDRLHRKCIIADYNYIKKMTNVELRLQQLQQLIIGNTPFDNDEKLSIVDTVLSNIIIYSFIYNQKQTAYYNSSLKLSKTILEDRNVNRQFVVEYSNPYIHDNNAYPTQVNINIRAEKNVECKFKLSNFVFEKKKEVSFVIPSNYEITKP